MKRAVVLTIVLLSAAFCFAGGKRSSIEAGVGFHRITETTQVSGIEIKTTVPSLAVNVAGIHYFSDRAGIGVYGNVLFPRKFKVTAQGQTAIVDKSAYDMLMAADALLGPVFMLYRGESFCLPMSFGFHWYSLWTEAGSASTNLNQIGMGANIAGEYHFGPKVYAFARFQLSCDFYGWGKAESVNQYGNYITESESGKINIWSIAPSLGIAFKW